MLIAGYDLLIQSQSDPTSVNNQIKMAASSTEKSVTQVSGLLMDELKYK